MNRFFVAFVGLVFLAWAMFGLAIIRMDSGVAEGQSAYVPPGSLSFETVTFVLLVASSILSLLYLADNTWK